MQRSTEGYFSSRLEQNVVSNAQPNTIFRIKYHNIYISIALSFESLVL